MITRIGLGVALSLSALLTGCCPNGCFVLHGEAYERLAHPKPYIESWEKSGTAPDVRKQDAMDCDSGFRFSPQFISENRVKAAQRPGETEDNTYARLFHDWERCMLKKGYRYTSPCYDNDISRASPACGAP